MFLPLWLDQIIPELIWCTEEKGARQAFAIGSFFLKIQKNAQWSSDAKSELLRSLSQ